jgi:mannose-6-phosphate isomerase-like protein (cupin superfamily)
MDDKINLQEKLSQFTEYWSPRTFGQLNDFDLMVVKVKGEFVWHQHDDTDDFLLNPGELYVVPRGVQHCPRAEEETHLLLIEPTGTPNTGDAATAAPRKTI